MRRSSTASASRIASNILRSEARLKSESGVTGRPRARSARPSQKNRVRPSTKITTATPPARLAGTRPWISLRTSRCHDSSATAEEATIETTIAAGTSTAARDRMHASHGWFWITQPLETRAVGPLFRGDGLVLVGHCGARLNRGTKDRARKVLQVCVREKAVSRREPFRPVAERQDDESGCDRKPYAYGRRN